MWKTSYRPLTMVEAASNYGNDDEDGAGYQLVIHQHGVSFTVVPLTVGPDWVQAEDGSFISTRDADRIEVEFL